MMALQGRKDRISEVINSYPGAFFKKVLIVWSIFKEQNALGGKEFVEE